MYFQAIAVAMPNSASQNQVGGDFLEEHVEEQQGVGFGEAEEAAEEFAGFEAELEETEDVEEEEEEGEGE